MYYFNFLNLEGKDITYIFWTKFSNSGYSDIAPPLPSNYLFWPPSGKFMNQLSFYSYKHRLWTCMLYFCKTHFHSCCIWTEKMELKLSVELWHFFLVGFIYKTFPNYLMLKVMQWKFSRLIQSKQRFWLAPLVNTIFP